MTGIGFLRAKRHATRFAEATIGEADAVGLDELRRRGLVGVSHFWAAMHHFWLGVNHDGRALVTQPRQPPLGSKRKWHGGPAPSVYKS